MTGKIPEQESRVSKRAKMKPAGGKKKYFHEGPVKNSNFPFDPAQNYETSSVP